MKYVNKVLASLLVLAICYLGYGFFQLRQELFTVFDVPERFAHSPTEADLVIVDFNKYGCGHCRSLHPVLLEAIKRDGKVRYIPRTVTHGLIWDETLAASVYAAGEQGKFIEMHNKIYDKWPINSHKVLFNYAKGLGLDVEKLSRDMKRPEIMERVRENQRFFEAWRFRRIPTLLMGKKAVYTPGEKTPTVEELLEKFADARS